MNYTPVLSLEERILIKELKTERKNILSIVGQYKALSELLEIPYTPEEKELAQIEIDLENNIRVGKLFESENLLNKIINIYEQNKIENGKLIYFYSLYSRIYSNKNNHNKKIEIQNKIEKLLDKGIKLVQ